MHHHKFNMPDQFPTMTVDWNILTPIKLGSVTAKNRILMAAHSYGYVDQDGIPTQQLVDYVAERAKGGIGLVITGGTAVSIESAWGLGVAANIDDRIVPWYQRIAAAVHSYETLVFDQLMHVGGQLDASEGVLALAPSPIPHECARGLPVELDKQEIRRIINDFGNAARRVRTGGLDGVELKCDQGFLLHQFLSPYYNRRNDDYGGTFDRRIRFMLEVIQEVRTQVGSDFVVGIRITGDAMTPGDLTLDDSIKIAQSVETTKLIDYVHVNGATNSSYIGYLRNHGDSSIAPMNFASLARAIKRSIQIPVFLASNITHPQEAEYVVQTGIADMVAMTRSHIADAEIVNKIRAERIDDIRPCVQCNQGCVGNHWKGLGVRCIHNPATGREKELGIGTIVPSTTKQHIGIVGGGPAGLEAARVLAIRGHRVELFEKGKTLGGQVLFASRLPYRQGLLDIVQWLERQVRRLGVKIYEGVEVTARDLSSVEAYDALIIATGARPYIPPIYDAVDADCKVTVEDLLQGKKELGPHVLVVDLDWRQNPLGIVELLVQKGHKVTVISTAFYIGEGLDVATIASYYSRLHPRASLLPMTDLHSLVKNTARLRHVLSNETYNLPLVDNVVFVTGAKSSSVLYSELVDKFPNVYKIGDCAVPRGISEALLDANRLARTL